MEITLKSLKELKPEECQIVDIRSDTSFEYGSIDNAINIQKCGFS